MAKLRKPSQRTIDLYNQLVEQQNKVRKTLRRIHKQAEEALGAGRLPALVIPKSSHKIRDSNFDKLSKDELSRRLKMFWQRYREAKKLFSKGLKSYLAETVYKGYKELWQDSNSGIGEKPEGAFGRYSKEQIQNSPYGRAMEVYNILFTSGPELFLALLYTGRVIQFKYIYLELQGVGNKEYSWLEQQVDELRGINSPKVRARIIKEAEGLIGKYTHSESVERKVSNKIANEEAKLDKALGTKWHS